MRLDLADRVLLLPTKMQNNGSFTVDNFLATPSEIVSLMAHFRQPQLAKVTGLDFAISIKTVRMGRRQPATAGTRPAAVPAASPILTQANRTRLTGPCHCGTCQRCTDNARWDRIYDEKFADPDYYNRSCITHESSLARVS
jgi:hypothetical protein